MNISTQPCELFENILHTQIYAKKRLTKYKTNDIIEDQVHQGGPINSKKRMSKFIIARTKQQMK